MALLVFFDGARADCLQNADCPNLRSLIDGRWADGYRCAWSDAGLNLDEVPTLSYANHSTLITGTRPATHRVRVNGDVKKGVVQPSWLTLLRTARPELRTAAVFSDKNDAKIGPDPSVRQFVSSSKDWRECDSDAAGRMAEMYAGDDAPDAAMFFLEDPDVSGHYRGFYPCSEDYLAAFARSDAHLGKVLAAIKSRPTFSKEDWLIAFTTDHGGRGLHHGPDDGHCHTIPIVLAGRNVQHGIMTGLPRIYDVPVSLLAHFGVTRLPHNVVGHVLGQSSVPQTLLPREDGRTHFCRFDENFPATIDAAATSTPVSLWGYAGRAATGIAAKQDAPSPLYGRIEGRDMPAAFRFERSSDVFAGDAPSFSIAFWIRDDGVVYEKNPILLSNRNFYEERGAGLSLFLRGEVPEGGHGICLVWTGADGRPQTLGAFAAERGKWNFVAVVARPDGAILLYHGRSNGQLNWMAADGTGARLNSRLPVYLGQDGTGEYPYGPDIDVDEFSMWSRALSTAEINQVFKAAGR